MISANDGSVSARYKSSAIWNMVYGSGANGDYIAATVKWAIPFYLLLFNRATNVFSIKTFPGSLYGIASEGLTGR